MKVSKAFLKDFAYIAHYYNWTEQEIEEVKKETRESYNMKRYWEIMAAAHRAGYKQTESNNYIRLREWALENLIRDPFLPDFDTKEFDILKGLQ